MLAAIALAAPLSAAAAGEGLDGGHYVLDPRHSTVIARVSHMGVSLYTMRFDTIAASFTYDADHPEATRVEASVDPGSLDVNADYGRTFAEEFLQASHYPKATFVSTAIRPGPTPTEGSMTGDLTLMGVTRPVTFNVRLVGAGHEPLPLPLGQRAAGFEATATIHRSDFGSTFLSPLIGDEVTLQIDAEFDKR